MKKTRTNPDLIFDWNRLFFQLERILFVDMVIKHDAVQVIEFVLEDDGREAP